MIRAFSFLSFVDDICYNICWKNDSPSSEWVDRKTWRNESAKNAWLRSSTSPIAQFGAAMHHPHRTLYPKPNQSIRNLNKLVLTRHYFERPIKLGKEIKVVRPYSLTLLRRTSMCDLYAVGVAPRTDTPKKHVFERDQDVFYNVKIILSSIINNTEHICMTIFLAQDPSLWCWTRYHDELQMSWGKWLPPRFGCANHLVLINRMFNILQEVGLSWKISMY